jgi:hypothetical protein
LRWRLARFLSWWGLLVGRLLGRCGALDGRRCGTRRRLGNRGPVLDHGALVLLDALQFLAFDALAALDLLTWLGHGGVALDHLFAVLAGGFTGLTRLEIAHAGGFGSKRCLCARIGTG